MSSSSAESDPSEGTWPPASEGSAPSAGAGPAQVHPPHPPPGAVRSRAPTLVDLHVDLGSVSVDQPRGSRDYVSVGSVPSDGADPDEVLQLHPLELPGGDESRIAAFFESDSDSVSVDQPDPAPMDAEPVAVAVPLPHTSPTTSTRASETPGAFHPLPDPPQTFPTSLPPPFELWTPTPAPYSVPDPVEEIPPVLFEAPLPPHGTFEPFSTFPFDLPPEPIDPEEHRIWSEHLAYLAATLTEVPGPPFLFVDTPRVPSPPPPPVDTPVCTDPTVAVLFPPEGPSRVESCYLCGGAGGHFFSCLFSGPPRETEPTPPCLICGQTGHLAPSCPVGPFRATQPVEQQQQPELPQQTPAQEQEQEQEQPSEYHLHVPATCAPGPSPAGPPCPFCGSDRSCWRR